MKTSLLLAMAMLVALVFYNANSIRVDDPLAASPNLSPIGYGWPLVCVRGITDAESVWLLTVPRQYWKRTSDARVVPLGIVVNTIVAGVIAVSCYSFVSWLARHITFRLTLLSVCGLTAYAAFWIVGRWSTLDIVTNRVPNAFPIYFERRMEDAISLTVWIGVLISCLHLPHWLWNCFRPEADNNAMQPSSR